MKPLKKLTTILLYSLFLITFLACQTTSPFFTATPTNSPPTLTSTPTVPTFTPTPFSEENTWRDNCTSVSDLGQIGTGRVNDISFSKSQKLTAISSGAGLTVYNNENQSQMWFVPTNAPIVQSIFVKDDTEILAMDKDYRILTLDAQTGEGINATDAADVMVARLNEDGSMVMLADWLGVTYAYDTQQFDQIASTEAYIKKNETVTLFISDLIYTSIQFSPNSKLMMTAAFTGRITLFNAKNGALIAEYPLGQRAVPENVVFSNDSKHLAIEYTEEDGTQHIRILNVAGGFLKQTFQGSNPALSSNGKLLASQDRDKLMIWEVDTGKLLYEFKPKGHLAGKLRFSTNDQSLFSSSTTGIEIWNVTDGQLTAQMPGQYSMYKQVVIASKQNLIGLKAENYIEIRDATNGNIINEISVDSPIQYIAFNSDGTKLAGIIDKKAVIWNPRNSEVLDELELGTDFPDFIAFTANPNEFIAGKKYVELSLLQLEAGKIKLKNSSTMRKASVLAASVDGATVATSSYDTGIIISEPNDWKVVKSFSQDEKFVNVLAFAPSSKVLAAAMENQRIKIWNTDGHLLCTLEDQPEHVTSMSFSSEGTYLFITALEEGYIRVIGLLSSMAPSGRG